ncbi:transcriptional regulator, DeoR family [Amphibacillus marinus]|uniref:Lactose phosphotransferase system repressor n=1 Tax=Amphibacillus marinus TaxID=872970 RepID=A0A1H8LAC3_9BACI|nr:DeoR/GlpR family DNA-binding transcription regulator [Amphibacillus marinus]SEO02063.1 transcriptional regulator, DeoR family [Amphibacillus marinus]
MVNELRKDQILSLLKKHKKMENSDLQKELFCSLSTLRRELLLLEKEGLIRRYRGGVVLEVEKNHVISTRYREHVMIREKEYIAEIASTFIGPGMSLFIDSSSTAKSLVPYLAKLPNSVIITNGLQIAYELLQVCQQDTKIYMIGGEAIKDAESVVGDYGNSFLELFHIDLCILSSTGIDLTGIYEANFAQALFKKKVMNLAKQSLLLVDYTKFGKSHAYKFSDWSSFESVITDHQPTQDYLEVAKKASLEFLY